MSLSSWSSGCMLLALLAQSILSTQADPLSRDPCEPDLCQNGGICTAPYDLPVCQCLPGFSGDHCQTPPSARRGCQSPVNLCGGTFCSVDEDCELDDQCCPSTCGGNLCTPRIVSRDPCRFFECQNGGTCTSPLDIPTCLCPPGFSGDLCQDTLTVKPGSCPVIGPNSVGVCGGTFCSGDDDCEGDDKCCPSACGGNLCTRLTVARDPCQFFECQNGGTCTSPLDIPTCLCPSEFSGDRCQDSITVKPGSCPVIGPRSVGVCGGTFCMLDDDCEGDDKCCPSACGGNMCTPFTEAFTVTSASPSLSTTPSCELTTCAAYETCRLVKPCIDCATEARCEPKENDIDLCGGCGANEVCRQTGLIYQCVKIDACGGCPPGKTCALYNECSPPIFCPPGPELRDRCRNPACPPAIYKCQ